MKSKFRYALFFLFLGAAVLACSSFSEVTSLIGESPGDILFEDDFSFVFSGWPRETDEYSSTDYVNNGYEVTVFQKDYVTWATSGDSFTDVDIQVEATFITGDYESYYGIICRHVDTDNFYAMVISNDGYYGILKTIQGGPFTLIPDEFLDYSDSINQDLDTNVIRGKCVKDRMFMYINGDLLLDVKDDNLASGEVGLIVGSTDADETTIFFDNFLVLVP